MREGREGGREWALEIHFRTLLLHCQASVDRIGRKTGLDIGYRQCVPEKNTQEHTSHEQIAGSNQEFQVSTIKYLRTSGSISHQGKSERKEYTES